MDMNDLGAKDMGDATPFEQLKIAIIGPPKGGKSRLAATIASVDKPAIAYDFDGRAASVAGTPGLFVKTLVDSNPMSPKAYDALYRDIGKFEYEIQQGNKLPFEAIILDSITYMSAAAMSHVMNSMGSDKSVKTFSVGPYSMRVARGFDPYVAETELIANTIIRCMSLGVHVICVFHERPEEAPESTQDNPRFTGKFSVHPPRMAKILPLFNEQWRITPENGLYRVQTKPGYQFIGASCLLIEDQEEPDIRKMILKHQQKVSQITRK